MNRRLALLLVSFLLVFGLTACGGDDKQQHENNSAITGEDTAGEDSTGREDAGEHDAADGEDSLKDDVEQGVEDVREDVDDAARDVEDALDGAAERTRQARPQDKDGDLTDQENGFARNSLR